MSDSPEEQPNSSSVLGRIGSWLWARSPIGSAENASPTSPDHPEPKEEQDSLSEDVFYPVSQPEGQPSGEETAEEEWEEASSSFQSGNSTADQNASRLTRFPPEVHGQPDKTHTQEGQAQAGKKLHVYLEETSVTESAGEEVVCKYSKSLQVRPKSRSSVSLDSEKGQSYSSALVGVNLNSQKVDNLEEGDEMGRKNARRRYRKNSQGDSIESSNVTQPNRELTDKDKTKSPKSKAASPASKTTPAPSPALPEPQKSHSSGPGYLNSGQDNSSSACAEAAEAEASMEADDSFYRVERKTETPESKRRSMKVSKSEVKLFTKNVPLKSAMKLVVTREEGREQAAADLRLKEAKKPEDKPKSATGRIADKISLFENRKLGGAQLFDTPRSADVSPIRRPTGRLKAEHALAEQRSRSDECLDKKRSNSTSPPRQRGLTIKERVKNFNDANMTTASGSPKQSISRIHHKVTASRSLEILDLPDKPDVNEKTVSKAVTQVNGADSKARAGDLKVESPELTKKEETNTSETKDANDSNKVPTRTGSRNKKRRSKEPISPKTETRLESNKQNLDIVDGKQIEQEDSADVAMQVTDSITNKSHEASNVHDAMTTKDAKIQSTNQKSEKRPPASCTKAKLDESTAKEAVTRSTEQEKADVKNNDKTIPTSSVKPPREDTGNKLDSSKGQGEVTSSSPLQRLDDKESKTVATPDVKNISDLATEKSQVKLSEKVSSSTDKEQAKTSTEQCDLQNKEGNTSNDTTEKGAASASDKIVQEPNETSLRNDCEVPTVKQEKSIEQQKAIAEADSPQPTLETTGNEQNLSSVKQASSSAIDKTVPHPAEQLTKVASASSKMEENTALEGPRESKQDGPSGKLENAATSGEQRPRNKLKGTTEGASNETQKTLPDTDNKVDLSSGKEVAITSEQKKTSDKLEGATQGSDEKPSIEENKSIPSDKNKVELANIKQDVSAPSEELKLNDKSKTKEVTDTEKANLSNAKNESDSASNVQKPTDGKTIAIPVQEKATIQESSLPSDKDVARLDGTEEKTAHLSVSKLETDTSSSSDHTKAAIDESPAILPQKGQEIVDQNSVLFTGRTDGLVMDEKERLAALDLPAAARNANKSIDGLGAELLASKLQSKQDAEVAVTGVIEKGGKLVKENKAGEIETLGKQVLDNGRAKLGQEVSVGSQNEISLEKFEVEKQENSSKITPNNTTAEELEGAENNAYSVKDNEREREGHTHTIVSSPLALTKSTKIHGKEAEPKAADAPEPQAECVTAEKNSQNRPDESALESRPITANAEALTVAKNDISEQKDVVENASRAGEGEKASHNVDDKVSGDKMSPDSPQLARDLIKQAGSEFEKAITNIASMKIAPANELVAIGDVTVLPKGAALKEDAVSSNKQSLKASPEANKSADSSRKRRNLPKGRSKDDWSLTQQQDAPSSWLDVDFPRQKLKVASEARLKPSGSESNLLDTSADLDDEDFVEKIKKLCAPFQLPPRKHNHLRPPQPPFAMPAIKEDRFEKTFDPEEFTIGLRKINKFSLETSSLRAKLQSSEGKSSIKPARASLADRSMLLSSLESRFRDKANGNEEQEEAKDEAKDEIKVKSRLEGSCVLSSLTTSSFRSKLSQSQAQAESTESGNVSPSNSPQQQSPQQPGPPPLSPATANPERSHTKEEVQSGEQPVVCDSAPPLPTFDQIKLPGFLEKYLPREAKAEAERGPGTEQQVSTASTETGPKMPSVKEEVQNTSENLDVDKEPGLKQPTLKESAQDSPGDLQLDSKVAVKMPTVAGPTVEMNVKEEQKLPESVANHFSGISLKDKAPPPSAPLRRRPSKKKRAAKGFHKRPGKMLLFEKAPFEGQLYEVHRDMEDATSLLLSPLITVKVVRGCWVLYEKPGFQGRTVALEEGTLELTNVWAEPGPDPEKPSDTPMQIGSIRLAVADYSVPHIDLFTEPEGRGRVTPYHDDSLETGSFGIPLSTASIQVHSGVWLVFSDPGFQGMLAVLEPGGYPYPETWGFPSPFVGSLRPLKMGGFKVENPNEVKAVVYEKAGFEGLSLDIEADVFSFGEEEGDAVSSDSTTLQSVGSLKVHGGLWVGYSEPGFEGQQYILEEGEYQDCGDWGGAEILSIRPIMADFMSPHLKMFSDKNFGKLGVNIDLTVPVINVEETGYGLKTQSMDVLSGVWVVFEEAGFCGESYIVEKGQYGSPEDWGGTRPSIASAMPVLLENFENTAKFKVQLFSEADFRGSSLILEDSEGSLPNGFSVASCKVLAGSWLAFEGQDFSRRMYVLDEGTYPDLRAMGCVHADASILSLQIVGFEFSVPSIVLFERSGLKGKRVVLSGGVVNLQMSGGGGRVQSVLVEGGMWVLYEEINFRGAQVLLRPGEVSDWRSFCHWKKIGSLRPLLQKQVHFHLRNSLSGQLMTVTGDLDDIKLLRVQEMEETQGFEQIWFFQNGHLHCKLLEECCLCPSSSVTIAGARVGLTPALDENAHLWSITPEGFICYSGATNLVLDVKGGHNYDKSQVVLNTLDPKKLQQQWRIEVL